MTKRPETEIAQQIWSHKYRYRQGERIHDQTIEDTWRRVARALASVETREPDLWEQRFYSVLEGFQFIPAGRILAGAGTSNDVTLFNCFVMGRIGDSIEEIFEALKEGALTMQQGGGVGYDFSTLRPVGTRAERVGTTASGPVSFMKVWDSMCATLLSTGARRGAMMGTLRCDHPDIEAFIRAKQDPRELRHFNISVLVSDDFLSAVRDDASWPLQFPVASVSGSERVVPHTYKSVSARTLWEAMIRSAYDFAEPGVLFIDRINRLNNLWYREQITSTNPCGEIPLPPYGACDLGSLNLTRFVRQPFTDRAEFDLDRLQATVEIATRMLDNVIPLSRYPLQKQRDTAHGTRRIGLGITGLADCLIMLGLVYGSEASYEQAVTIMRTICHQAYRSSIKLAVEKGSFPYLEQEKFLQGSFIKSLPEDIQEGIRRRGIRNSHLLAIAPTGTISLLAGNVSSGIEPVYDFAFTRRVRDAAGHYNEYAVEDYAWHQWHRMHHDRELPPAFIGATQVSPEAHLRMQASLQPYVDNAISKTINIPAEYDYEAFRSLYMRAYELGLKGCTAFRPNEITGSILQAACGAACL